MAMNCAIGCYTGRTGVTVRHITSILRELQYEPLGHYSDDKYCYYQSPSKIRVRIDLIPLDHDVLEEARRTLLEQRGIEDGMTILVQFDDGSQLPAIIPILRRLTAELDGVVVEGEDDQMAYTHETVHEIANHPFWGGDATM